jgi:undecaprenyl-diphosphatase
MTILQALILGAVQGLTEFFPVSSSGHLVLAGDLLDVTLPGVSFEVMVHAATLFAVLFVYRRRVTELIVGLARRHRESVAYLGKLGVATLPAAAVGLLGAEFVASLFDAPTVAAVNLLFTGAIVYSTRWLMDRGDRPAPGWLGSLAVGAAQAIAILPGISRSGSTVAAALVARAGREPAAEFSFLLSVPAIVGASLLEAPELASQGATVGVGPLLVAAIAAFFSGVAAILLFVRWLRLGSFHRFAYYCWVVGGLYLVYEAAWA